MMEERPIPIAREDLPWQQGVAFSRDDVAQRAFECEDALRFEWLLSDLSARFVHVTAAEMDTMIEAAQRCICEYLDLDLVALWQMSDESAEVLALTHLYSAQEGLQLSPELRQEDFPWTVQQVLAGRMVTLSSLDELPAAANRDRDVGSQMGIKSSLIIPLSVGGKPAFGALCLNTMRAERDWPEALVNRLHLVAQLFAGAISRKQADQKLRESEARLASAVELAEMGFYEVTDGRRFTFLDRLGRDLTGLPEGQDMYEEVFELWAGRLHPEDRSRVLELQRMQREGQQDKVNVEYRYLHPQRGTIWIHHLTHILERDADGHSIRTIGVVRDITDRKVAEEELREMLEEVQRLRDRLNNENVYMRKQLRLEAGHGGIIGETEPMQRVNALVRKVAPTDSSVLITGETGTGKELVAQAIHDLSARKSRLMVKVNCAALPAPLIESELFGREKGAYTGAMTHQVGRFEVANGSTIFLDEIGDLPLELQVKLLRVLQDGQFERLGSHKPMTTDIRVIAATNRDLAAAVRKGTFREDLLYRLNVFPIVAPPLRTRVDDIPLLAWSFIQEFNSKMGRAVDTIPKATMERLSQYPWPGNVRELRNVIERAMIVSEGRFLSVELPDSVPHSASHPRTLGEIERKHILDVLERTHWRIRGEGGAAEILGLAPTTLHSRMKKHAISRPAR